MGNINPSTIKRKLHLSDSNSNNQSDSDLISINSPSSHTSNQPQKPQLQQSQQNITDNNKKKTANPWNCDICDFSNMASIPLCKQCNSPKPSNNIWCWQDDNANYQPYPAAMCKNIDTLSIGDIYTVTINNVLHEIKRVALDTCVQTNLKTQDIQLIVLRDPNDHQNQHQQHQQHHSSNHNQKSSAYRWHYQRNDKSYGPFQQDQSQKIDALNVGGTHSMYIRGTKYIITKISKQECTQKNTKTNYVRKVICKKLNNNNNHQNDDDSKDEEEDVWCWESKGSYRPYTSDISHKLDRLSIGGSITVTFGNTDYEITKISHHKCEQKNKSTNYVRKVIRRSADNNQSSKPRAHHSRHRRHNDQDNDDEKKDDNKWYWKDDHGKFKSCGYNVSKILSKLTINGTQKIEIHQKWYDFKKVSATECEQKNTKTGKIRDCRLAKFGWYFKTNNGSFKPYTDDTINEKINAASIGHKVTFNIGRSSYSVIKKSWTTAEQINNGSNKKRDMIRKMILNENIWKRNTIDKKKVNELFHATCPKPKYNIIEVKDLTKNANELIYESILQGKCRNSGKKRADIEKYLWHGTRDLANLQLIIKNGFDRSFNTASAYGKGTYFAKCASYSVGGGYCGKDASGVYSILLCKVIVGDYAKGSSGIKTIPRKSDGTEYETLVNDTTNPSIFVVWRDYHAVPCYLVKYKV